MRPRISIRGSVRPSVGPSVRRSVRPSVRPSVTLLFRKRENAWIRLLRKRGCQGEGEGERRGEGRGWGEYRCADHAEGRIWRPCIRPCFKLVAWYCFLFIQFCWNCVTKSSHSGDDAVETKDNHWWWRVIAIRRYPLVRAWMIPCYQTHPLWPPYHLLSRVKLASPHMRKMNW